jgi:hypothetical protein
MCRRGRAVASTALGATPYVEEALRWLPKEVLPEKATPPTGAVTTQRARVLVADDNADMRDYVRRLLVARAQEVPAQEIIWTPQRDIRYNIQAACGKTASAAKSW